MLDLFRPSSPFILRARGVSFSPLSLFAASEPGVWLDPSDLTTMFQDAAGTTPVTAPGQSVGLVLDKSKGLGLGPELVTNGTFDTADGWNLEPGWTISGGTLNKGVTSTNGESAMISFSSAAGKSYKIEFDYINTSGLVSAGFSTTLGGALNAGSFLATGASGRARFILTATATVAGFGFIGNFTNVFTIDNISVRELPGNHATQATAAARPTYQVDSNGRGYLSFDGVDDWLVTPTITPGIDKVQVFAGVRKLSDAASAILLETSVNASGSNGAVYITAPELAANGYAFLTKGTTNAGFIGAPLASYPAPITNVLTGLADISDDRATIRINGSQVAQSTGDQGTGNFLAYPLYIGRRAGTSLPFNGRIYGLIVRFGANLTADQITRTEAWMNSKTGAF